MPKMSKNSFQKVWRSDFSEVVPFHSRENLMDQWRISSQESISGLTGANRQRLVAASHFTFTSPESLGLVDDQSRGGGGEAQRARGRVINRLALSGR